MSQIHNSIEVGVTYQGLMSNRLKAHVRTSVPARMSPFGQPLFVSGQIADGKTQRAIYIKATGKALPAGGKRSTTTTRTRYFVDGVGGLNVNAEQQPLTPTFGWATLSLFQPAKSP